MSIYNCPSCNTKPLVNDFVSCDNAKCLEFELKYLPYEWNNMIDNLSDLYVISVRLILCQFLYSIIYRLHRTIQKQFLIKKRNTVAIRDKRVEKI